MQGLLLVDKPSGWTSFDVVNYVRKLARKVSSPDSPMAGQSYGRKPTVARPSDNKTDDYPAKLPKVKVGHTGTLDPLATGLLVLLVGKDYTRKAMELTKLDKTYEVTMKLGETSTTGDAEGTITPFTRVPLEISRGTLVKDGGRTTPALEAVQEALGAFQGHIMQVPPQFSAMKVNGQRAYRLARAGKPVELEARPVTINDLRLTKYEYPYVEFTADVGSGTYIRSLVEDLGKTLGTGAYMSDLRRTRVGQFDISDALEIDHLNPERLEAALRQL